MATSKLMKNPVASSLNIALRFKESEVFYRYLAELSPQAVVVHSKGKIVYINPAGVRLTGAKDLKKILNKSISNFIHPESQKTIKKRLANILTDKKVPPVIEEKFISMRGRVIIGEVQSAPIVYKNELAILSIIRDVTEERKLKNTLKEQADLLKVASEAFIILDDKRYIKFWNNGAQDLYGYTVKEALGKKSLLLLHTKFPVPFKQVLSDLKNKGLWTGKLVHQNKKGETIVVQSRWQYIVDSSGPKIFEVNRDITEQERARESLKSSEERFRALIENSSDVIYLISKEGKITYSSASVKDVLGYTYKETIVKKIADDIHPDDLSYFSKKFSTLLEKPGSKITVEYRVRNKLAYYVWVQVTFTNYLKNQKINAVIGNLRDITEQKQHEISLTYLAEASKILSSSLDYKTTLKNVVKLAVPKIADWASIDILTDDKLEQLAIAHVNPQKVKWAKELRKKNPVDLQSDTGLAKVLRTGVTEYYPNISDKMLASSVKNKEQLENLRQVGLSSVIIAPLCIDNKPIGAITLVSAESKWHYTKADVAIAQELAQRAALAIENARLYAQSQKAVSVRDDFISIASHELKTPLTSLKMYTQVLQKQLEKKGEVKLSSYLIKMSNQIDNLSSLVRDLLDVSRLEHGELEFREENFNLSELTKEVVFQMQPLSPRHKITLTGEDHKYIVHGDRYRLYQVLINFLTNAVKYSPQADKVDVSIKKNGNSVTVYVQDFGIGIDAKYQQNIFKRFYRVNDQDEKTYPGLGLGLYITFEIIKRHGGKVKVESTKGKGSVFSFSLPLVA